MTAFGLVMVHTRGFAVELHLCHHTLDAVLKLFLVPCMPPMFEEGRGEERAIIRRKFLIDVTRRSRSLQGSEETTLDKIRIWSEKDPDWIRS